MTRLTRSTSRTPSAKLAAALLLLTGTTGSLLADATWVGDTSQDWNNAANWSSDPATPTGNFFVNTATAGVFPIISATSAFAPVDIMVGNGAGQTGRLDITAGSVTPGAGNWFLIGREGGTGTVNVGGTGILNCNGVIGLGEGFNNATTSVGTLNVDSGGTVNSEGDLRLSFAGTASTVGTLNIAAGGTVNVASTNKRWLIMSVWDATSGVLNVNGGALNLNANTDIQFSTGNWDPGASNGPSAINLNSGSITMGAASVVNLNNNASRAVNHTINLNGGVFTVGSFVSSRATGARVINFNGGTLRAAGTQAAFLADAAVSAANVKAGGALIDSNGFDITIAKPLLADTVSTGGGLTKLGAGTLTLTGVNTYTGDTAVNAGTLALADNASLKFVIGANNVGTKITGSGAVTLDGDFVLDLSAASTTVGHSWQLVDAANLTETYGSTFNFGDFGLTSGKWLKLVGGTYYQFDPATGVLSVVNNPTIPAPTVTAKPSRSSYATGSDIQFGVSATGVGTLTYQWYFQATGSPTAVLITDATSANYTIPAATSANEGVYSVVVTDSASNTPTTVAFPTFTLQAGTAFSLAYYRFENDAIDEIGSNDLIPLGSPAYAAAVPVPTISRTGAPNTASTALPATGDNAFSAPIDSTLATAALEDFTIEGFVRFDSLTGWQTIVGRDDDATGQGVGGASLFYLSKAGAAVGGGVNNGFRIELINKNNTNLQVNSQKVPDVGVWYHVAAVGDATKGTLTLYVDGLAVGTTTGFTGLLVPTSGSETPWTIGRGEFNNTAGDYLRGSLDEVRFSGSALPPSQFLIGSDQGIIVPPPIAQAPQNRTVAAGSSTTLEVVVTGGANYEWYKNDVLISGQNGSTLTLSNVSAANEGVYRVKAINTLDAAVFSSATATVRVLTVPSAGRRTVGLNFVGSGSGGWSDVIYAFGESEVAGFYASTNWNNSAAVSNVANQSTPLALEESNGLNPAGTTATWASANTWSARTETGAPSAKSEHGKLIHGYIESRSGNGSTVTLNNIPYASYDVYVYVSGGNGGDRVGSVGINRDGTSTYFFRTLQNDTTRPVVTAEAPYAPLPMIGDALTIEEARAAVPATFVRYTGVTGSELTISGKDAVANQNAGGIAAVQIVDTTPAGAAYPPVVTTAPASKLVKTGATVSLSVAATAANAGGTLSYAWTKEGSATVLGTSATLNLGAVAVSATGNYTVTVTESASGLSASTATRSASVVVVDATRSVLINGDINAGVGLTQTGHGILRADGTATAADLGTGTTVWNGLLGGGTSGTLPLAKESTGLSLSGLTFSYANATGAEENSTLGDIATSAALQLSRDYIFTTNQSTPITARIGGLQAFAGHRVTLLAYAYGKTTNALLESTTGNDTATLALDPANNHLGLGSAATTTWETGTADAPARRLEYNNLEYTSGQSAAYVSFTGVVAANGTVTWTVGADADGGLIPLVGFQLLLTSENLAPAAPTNLVATPGNAQVGLTWTASAGPGVATYTVLRSNTAGGPYDPVSLGSITGTSHTDASAVNGNTYHYVVSAVAANPVLASAYSNEATATLASTASALETWRQANFGSPANSGSGADSADPDSDGLANLLEYALGTGPNAANASPVVVARSGNFLTLSYPHGADSTITYHVDASNDLTGSWTLGVGETFTVSGTKLHTDTVNLTAQPRRFLRLRVTTP